MGLDRLIGAAALCASLMLTAGCDSASRPERLLYGEPAAEFRPVDGSVVTRTRVVRAAFLGRRFTACARGAAFPADSVVVERVGVFAESLTFRDRGGLHVYACDGGVGCGRSVGRLYDGRLLDARLDLLCRDQDGKRLAFAWVEPAAGVHWIGVDQGHYIELYEIAAGLPVRVATRRGIDDEAASATFPLMQYDVRGRELIRTKLEAAVAG